MTDPAAPDRAGSPDPFTQIISIISGRLSCTSTAIYATCRDYTAYEIIDRRASRLTFQLTETEDADAVARAFTGHVVKNPPPNPRVEFEDAVRKGRELAATAGIPFTEIDAAFREATRLYHRAAMPAVLPPSGARLLSGERRAGPYLLADVPTRELMNCLPLFEKMRAFLAHARGAGVIPESPAENRKPGRRPLGKGVVKRDKKTEARDKWIYQQCCARERTYASISRALEADHPEWEHIESATGIQGAAKRYALRHGKPMPPPRLRPG